MKPDGVYDMLLFVARDGDRFEAKIRYPNYDVCWTRDTLEAVIGAAVLYMEGADCGMRAKLVIDEALMPIERRPANA